MITLLFFFILKFILVHCSQSMHTTSHFIFLNTSTVHLMYMYYRFLYSSHVKHTGMGVCQSHARQAGGHIFQGYDNRQAKNPSRKCHKFLLWWICVWRRPHKFMVTNFCCLVWVNKKLVKFIQTLPSINHQVLLVSRMMDHLVGDFGINYYKLCLFW